MVPVRCHLQIDRICLNIKISVMGEQLRAHRSFSGAQSSECEAIGALRCQIFSCLNQFAACLWCATVCLHVCVYVCVCKRTYTCVHVECQASHLASKQPRKSFDAFRVSVPEQFRG